jgi:hypothetical protein
MLFLRDGLVLMRRRRQSAEENVTAMPQGNI